MLYELETVVLVHEAWSSKFKDGANNWRISFEKRKLKRLSSTALITQGY